MGTSASSKGPSGGVPMVPPWVPDPLPETPPPEGEAGPTQDNAGEADQHAPDENAGDPPQPVQSMPVPIAPAARFRGARRNLGSFASTGSSDDMRRGLGHYGPTQGKLR